MVQLYRNWFEQKRQNSIAANDDVTYCYFANNAFTLHNQQYIWLCGCIQVFLYACSTHIVVKAFDKPKS